MQKSSCGIAVKPCADAAVLGGLVGVAARHDRNPQLVAQAVGQPFNAHAVFGDVLAVEVDEIKPGQLVVGQVGNMAAFTEGVGGADQNRIFVKQAGQRGKGQKLSALLVGFQPAVQLPDGVHRAD